MTDSPGSAIADRFKRHGPLKAFGTAAFILLFFLAYFAALNHPQFPVHVMRPGLVDRWIPYQQWTLIIYLTLWFYVSLPPALLPSRRALFRYGLVAAALGAGGLAVFVFWPTKVVHEGADFLKRVDPGGNAFPSLHVAYAVLTGVTLDQLLRSLGPTRGWRLINAAWCLAIVYSTLSTKQHVFADAAAGAAMGLAAAQFCSSSRLNVPD